MVVAVAYLNMYYVYNLRNIRDGKIYTGYTNNLRQKISQHKYGSVHTTKRYGEIELIYYEAFKNEQDARDRERYLKTTQGKRTLKLMLKNTFHAPIV